MAPHLYHIGRISSATPNSVGMLVASIGAMERVEDSLDELG
ncbi:MAG: hypothetical protein ABW061_03430 [Polyangiaceae bacterium]